MGYAKLSYKNTPLKSGVKKPLLIGCSGGAGHNAAITGIHDFLQKNTTDTLVLRSYNPVSYERKSPSPIRSQISKTITAMGLFAVGPALKLAVSFTPYPVLCDKQSLANEIKGLSSKTAPRPYIDMLLDVYPAGYESAAIWNVLQRNDKIDDLRKLVDLQHTNDAANYQPTYDYFLEKLKDAAINKEPYTELVSTQAMGLPALCDVVRNYNEWVVAEKINAPRITIHQYMTDLATPGAVHFFNTLSRLTPEQQRQMTLYGVGMNKKMSTQFFPRGEQFDAVYDLDTKNNPMVRPGFMTPALDNSQKYATDVSIVLAGKQGPESYDIKANEQIASIMLGSQAGISSTEYIETLLNNGMDKVFVFGGQNGVIKERIDELSVNPLYKDRIIALHNQGDKEIAALMSRSNCLIIRGGGLTVMEQLAMQHNPQQTVLIHHAESGQPELTSGISWEDENVNFMIKELQKQNVHAEKTSPLRAKRQIPEAQLIAAVKRFDGSLPVDTNDAISHIQNLSDVKLASIVAELNAAKADPALPESFILYIQSREKTAQEYVDLFEEKLRNGIIHLREIIAKETPADPEAELSSEVRSAKANCEAMEQLHAILVDEKLSAARKLENFKTQFNDPEVSKAFNQNNDGLITYILKQIIYYLAQYFPSLEKNLSYQQEFKRQVENIKVESEEDTVEFSPSA
ncbi:hypothetical protein [Legionella shakespearei]|uniref:Dot/Icm system substrate protein SdbA n=1 Tax=Legionella shakespearei DSM 23087 TaxID=1122169 RepID=A0A0W0YT25_9GAMM|nr:hypothetical protein [Legionella shakespearei]KTD60041.1 Dot/Icm system substrate protein SdbA [Legionella shakespearei DSM 23087]